ncbi:DUF6754 domain-containing protein [Chloroflexus sp.]|uniref:DUF6754 domain-containing protein n=1 Tax=Chloroflexus sp. TaxID=1904827 RepID=UPI00298EF840|nr:DUF6754 domain-containing protein [Chloroflexus sp.]MDW8404828.1 hypothetical protein [Chloroflexus sp.]
MSLPAGFFIIALTVVIALVWLHHARVIAGRLPARQPQPALDALRAALARSAETGRPVHLSPGASTIGAGEGQRASTAELLAGLSVVRQASEQAAASGAAIVVSSADAIAHLALRGTVRQSYRAVGQPQAFDPSRIELWAHADAMAYAAATAAHYHREPWEASSLTGAFGQEVLLAAETGAQYQIPQVLGSTHPAALGVMAVTTPHLLVGEEIYVAEAHLTTAPQPQARLLTHDTLRTAVIWLMVLSFGYGLIRTALGWPALPGW